MMKNIRNTLMLLAETVLFCILTGIGIVIGIYISSVIRNGLGIFWAIVLGVMALIIWAIVVLRERF